jgi:hypothetical protein
MGMPVRIDEQLYAQAKAHSVAERRSIAGQIEFWAMVGKAALDSAGAAKRSLFSHLQKNCTKTKRPMWMMRLKSSSKHPNWVSPSGATSQASMSTSSKAKAN